MRYMSKKSQSVENRLYSKCLNCSSAGTSDCSGKSPQSSCTSEPSPSLSRSTSSGDLSRRDSSLSLHSLSSPEGSPNHHATQMPENLSKSCLVDKSATKPTSATLANANTNGVVESDTSHRKERTKAEVMSQVVRDMDLGVQGMLKFAKCVPDFDELPREDQAALLKGNNCVAC